jgi:hypothetical protein
MKGFVLVSAAVWVAWIAPAKASNINPSCAGFLAGSSPLDVNRFYADRAVSIVRAGLDGDNKTLGALVSPIAKFALWRGDNAIGRQVGVAGAIEMARSLAGTRFQTMTNRPGPISISAVKCEWSAIVLFRARQPETSMNVTFKFVDGLLIEAEGHEVDLYEGDVR